VIVKRLKSVVSLLLLLIKKVMINILEKCVVKVPNDIHVVYSSERKIIVLIGIRSRKVLKLKVQLLVCGVQNVVKVAPLTFFKVSNHEQKKINSIQGTCVALIKQLIVEISVTLYRKLKLVGVGYRALEVDSFKNKLLLFKLGFSHFLYFKIVKSVKIFSLKLTKLFIYGNSYKSITQIASLIRSYKKPEPYNGKGILYDTEKIVIKEGKKV
jgi:large subunit ribosomal protein L6